LYNPNRIVVKVNVQVELKPDRHGFAESAAAGGGHYW